MARPPFAFSLAWIFCCHTVMVLVLMLMLMLMLISVLVLVLPE